MDWVYPAVLVVLEDHIYNIKGRNDRLPRTVLPLGEARSILRRGFFLDDCDCDEETNIK